MKHPLALTIVLGLLTAGACSEKVSDDKEASGGVGPNVPGSEDKEASAIVEPVEAEAELAPDESEALALDQDGNAIPATIEVPKGSSIFADSSTSVRIEAGKGGANFGVQVALGNEYNTNLVESAEMLREGGYGATHEVLEETPTRLRYRSTRDGVSGEAFTLVVDLKGTKWVCKQGKHGGWTDEQVAAQMAACQTLTAR